MLITACVKNRGTEILPHFQSLIALLFKDEGVLANHPRRVFGCLENGKKMKETRREEKNWRNTIAKTFINRVAPLTVSSLGAFIAKPLYKITKKIISQNLLQSGPKKKGRKPKK